MPAEVRPNPPVPFPADPARRQQPAPLRVAVACESPLGMMNGVTTSVRQTLHYLRDQGHEAIVVCPKPAPRHIAGFEVVRTATYALPLNQGFNLGIPGPKKVPRVLERFAPDVVHVASPAWTIGRTALTGARRLGIPSVAIYQTDLVRYAKRFGNRRFTDFVAGMLADLHNTATLNLAPSRPAMADLVGWGVEPGLLDLWGRGVDLELFDPARRRTEAVQQLRERILRGRDRPIVGYVGRLAIEKSVDRLAALADLDATVVVVGDGQLRETLQSALPDAVFLGELRKQRLADAYAALDLFVHTGSKETFGQTLQEAMASGLPVVAPAAGGPLDIVRHGETGLLFDHRSPTALHDAVARLLDDPAERAAMGEAGRRTVRSRSWAVLGEQLVGHYRAAIARAASPAGALRVPA